MGFKITKLEPVHGFAAETGAAATIELASRLGIPLSTTHTINTAIMGVGSTRRFSAVRWGVTTRIILAWLLTFPGAALIAGLFLLSFDLCSLNITPYIVSLVFSPRYVVSKNTPQKKLKNKQISP